MSIPIPEQGERSSKARIASDQEHDVEDKLDRLNESVKSLESKVDCQGKKLNKLISKVEDLGEEKVMKFHVLGSGNTSHNSHLR